MGMVATALLLDSSCMGSPGMERLRWLKPLRGGETVNVKFRILESELSKTRPDRGKLKVGLELYDKAGDLLMDAIATQFYGLRPKS